MHGSIIGLILIRLDSLRADPDIYIFFFMVEQYCIHIPKFRLIHNMSAVISVDAF